ncbi:MAG: hypothetical protein ACTS5Y_01990 [Pollutimonas bauzanensis]
MKQLLRKPLAFALLLSLPLWVVFDNYLVAIMVALLVAFLLSMCYTLYTEKTQAGLRPARRGAPRLETADPGHRRPLS